MAFFDKLGETISSECEEVAKKAKEMAEIAKLNGKISTQEDIQFIQKEVSKLEACEANANETEPYVSDQEAPEKYFP